MNRRSVLVILLSLSIVPLQTTKVFAQQTNFSISPPPVAWPYFEEGRSDFAVSGSYISMKADEVTLKGGVLEMKARQAFDGVFAVSAAGGLGGLGGKMPGIPPSSPIYTSGAYSYVPYYVQTTGKATAVLLAMNGCLDLEVQPIHDDYFGLILFGGLSFNFTQMTITTPYDLIVPPPYSNAGEHFTGYEDKLTIMSTLYGFQAGAQIDLSVDENVRVSPFFMITSMQGTASMSDSPGAAQASGASYSASIPRTTAYAFGMDIIIFDVSIGTMLQQMQAAGDMNKDTSIIMISASYHFSPDETDASP
jgi:hypothetical protein